VQAGTGATNVIPGEMLIDFNFRFCTESNETSLKNRLTHVLLKHALKFDIEWTLGGLPFLTTPGSLVKAVQEAILEVTGLRTELSTTGGTSDGRFIAQTCPQVIELGPPNATIHKIDEHVALVDIEPLKDIYKKVLFNLNKACEIEMGQKP
jgi:succinyl-diaminopimelate desuccinylase